MTNPKKKEGKTMEAFEEKTISDLLNIAQIDLNEIYTTLKYHNGLKNK